MNIPTLKEEKRLFKKGARFIAGVDEVGRGALAGPVCVGAVLLNATITEHTKAFDGLRDSKQLSPERRERFFKLAQRHEAVEDIAIAFVSAAVVDRIGIAKALACAADRAVAKLSAQPEFVFFDGGLGTSADIPQKAFIKGDEKIFVVALASVCAKVSRDRLMCRLAKKHPYYAFEQHKGYGTAKHYAALRAHGPSKTHRKSFL